MRPNILLSCLPRNLFSANLEKEGRSQFCWADFFFGTCKAILVSFLLCLSLLVNCEQIQKTKNCFDMPTYINSGRCNWDRQRQRWFHQTLFYKLRHYLCHYLYVVYLSISRLLINVNATQSPRSYETCFSLGTFELNSHSQKVNLLSTSLPPTLKVFLFYQ